MMRRRTTLLTSCTALTLALGATACGGGGPVTAGGGDKALGGQTVTVAGVWTGSEQKNFQKVLDAFSEKTGAKTTFVSTGDNVSTVVGSKIEGGNAPDVVMVPQVGVLQQFARNGWLKPLSGTTQKSVDANFAPVWKNHGSVDGTLYGLYFKAAHKSTVWYSPDALTQAGVKPPKTYDEMLKAGHTVSDSGLAAFSVAGQDGWTLTDWFENVYLRQAGPDKYRDLFAGKLSFTDPSVKAAVDAMMDVIHNDKYVSGGTTVASSVSYDGSLAKVFGAKPDGYLVMEGGFTTGVITTSTNPKLQPGTDIQFFHFPNIEAANSDAVELGGDFAVAFANNDLTKKFMQWLARPETAKLWAAVGVIDPNKNADASALPNVLMQQESQQLTTAKLAAFDGSDQMPGGIGDDWGSTLQGIYQDPSKTEQLLKTFADNAKSNGFGP